MGSDHVSDAPQRLTGRFRSTFLALYVFLSCILCLARTSLSSCHEYGVVQALFHVNFVPLEFLSKSSAFAFSMKCGTYSPRRLSSFSFSSHQKD